MALVTRILDPNNLRTFFDVLTSGGEILRDIKEDGAFVRTAMQVLRSKKAGHALSEEIDPFEPGSLATPRPAPGRTALVASGGSGATASVIGVQRACEEAGIEPVAIAACSGSVLFAGLWACGLPARDVAQFWLTLDRDGYLDLDLRALARSTTRAFGGWAGLVKGEALERSIRGLVGDKTLGELPIPFSMPAWNIDLNRVETFSSRLTPDLKVATALRVAIAIPIFVEPVRVGEHFYGDGGIIDIFPLRPVLERDPELVLGLNCYLPENFTGQDVTGWRQRPFAILRASGQLRWSGMVALAREQARLAGNRLELLHPVAYDEVRGGRFYETFVDRSKWPRFIRQGHAAARAALARHARPLASTG